MSLSARERAQSVKTLVCLIQGLTGKKVTIDFRDETVVHGRIKAVDGYMNIEMTDVEYIAPSGVSSKFDTYCCHGKFIRFVQIPEDVDPVDTIKDQLEVLSRMGRGGRGRGRGGGGRGRGGGGRGRGGGDGGRGGGYRSQSGSGGGYRSQSGSGGGYHSQSGSGGGYHSQSGSGGRYHSQSSGSYGHPRY